MRNKNLSDRVSKRTGLKREPSLESKRPPGRERLPDGKRGARYNVYLLPAVARYFKQLGRGWRRNRGSLSLGITRGYLQLTGRSLRAVETKKRK